MSPVHVLLIALLLAPFGLAACGDSQVTRAEGEPCVEAYAYYNAHPGDSLAGSGRYFEDADYWKRLAEVLRACTPRTLEFARDANDRVGETYDRYRREYCNAQDRYRESALCEGVPE